MRLHDAKIVHQKAQKLVTRNKSLMRKKRDFHKTKVLIEISMYLVKNSTLYTACKLYVLCISRFQNLVRDLSQKQDLFVINSLLKTRLEIYVKLESTFHSVELSVCSTFRTKAAAIDAM